MRAVKRSLSQVYSLNLISGCDRTILERKFSQRDIKNVLSHLSIRHAAKSHHPLQA